MRTHIYTKLLRNSSGANRKETHTLYMYAESDKRIVFLWKWRKIKHYFFLISFHEAFQMLLSIPVNFKAVTKIIKSLLKHNGTARQTRRKKRKWRGDIERDKERVRRWPIKRVRQQKYQQITHYVGEKRQRHNRLGAIHHFSTTVCVWGSNPDYNEAKLMFHVLSV